MTFLGRALTRAGLRRCEVYKPVRTAYNKGMTATTTHTDEPQFKIVHAWEILPSPAGHLHVVDPDPDAQVDSYPVSLCGTMLLSKGGSADDSHLCETCVEILHEREAER